MLNRKDAEGSLKRLKHLQNSKLTMFRKNDLDPIALKKIQDFSVWCEAHQVRLFATFPSLLYFPEYHNPEQRRFFNELVMFYKRIGVSVLGNPYNFLYKIDSFFDNLYHLNIDAAEKRTRQLINMLKQSAPDLFKYKH